MDRGLEKEACVKYSHAWPLRHKGRGHPWREMMSNVWMMILGAAVAYLLGSISFSMLFSKYLKHDDVRAHGSGNPGTTNMLRTYGWKYGLATLVCDVLKGALAALIGYWLAGEDGMYLAAVMVVVGHNFSCFLRFRGGKGIAAAIGAYLVMQPIPSLIIIACCLVLVFITRIMSVGTITGMIANAVVTCCISGGNWTWNAASIIIAVLTVYAHRDNIKRLLRGEENRLSFSKR